jgi:hypothetical protein
MRGVTGLGHATASGFAQPVRRAVREPGIVGPFPKLLAEIVPAIWLGGLSAQFLL